MLHIEYNHEEATSLTWMILIMNGFGAFVSVLTVFYIASQYKKDLLGFQPYEIAMLYAEYKSLLDQLSEAIISVDKDFKITTMNEKFKEMFHFKDQHKGEIVFDVFPHIDFKLVISSKNRTNNKLIEINNEKILLTTFPLYADGQVIGATAIIRSRLEVDMLLDQISGYRKMSKALREQKHEFQNKLHVILGLIKMKDFDLVQSYITENIYTTNLTSDYYSSRIKDDKVNALFVGKDIQSKEYDAVIRLTDDSFLSKKHAPIDSDDLVIVIGNLIDNALEAYNINNYLDERKVTVKIDDAEEVLTIGVKDSAGGIDPKVRDRMFKRGVSTKKGDSRGTGLSLVQEIVHLYDGEIEVQSNKYNTYIQISLKKVKK
jgi:CitB family two-component system sensor histidine kinase MalK